MTVSRPWIVQHYDSLPTTMDTARLLASIGVPDRYIVTATEQTSGRGRAGRSWQTPPGTALQATAILRPRCDPGQLPTLSLIIGVAVAEAIEAVTCAQVRLKWPNDVWIGADDERPKVAGILTTSQVRGDRIDHVLVGIGVNVTAPHLKLLPGATSLREATSWRGSPDDLLLALLPALDRGYHQYTSQHGRPSLDTWRARAALLGEVVTIEEHGQQLTGRFIGIDDDGALLLATDHSTPRRILSGDLVRGPRRATGFNG